MFAGTKLRGPLFGVDHGSFVVAVGPADQAVMTPICKLASRLCVVSHVHAPFIGPAGHLLPGVFTA